jgi:hypothetical protein
LTVPLFLDHRPETHATEEVFSVTMRRLRAVVGPAFLSRLGFDKNIAAAAEQSEHWHREGVPLHEADLLVVAHLVAAREDPGLSVPPSNSVPAFARLCPQTSHAEMIELLRRAIRLSSAIRHRLEA